jgi:hypothetical protein
MEISRLVRRRLVPCKQVSSIGERAAWEAADNPRATRRAEKGRRGKGANSSLLTLLMDWWFQTSRRGRSDVLKD